MVSEASLVVIRRPGRPKVEPHSIISAWVPATVHDRLIAAAQARGESVSKTISAAIAAGLSAGNIPTKQT